MQRFVAEQKKLALMYIICDSCCSSFSSKLTAMSVAVHSPLPKADVPSVGLHHKRFDLWFLCVGERERASLINDESCDAVWKSTDLFIHGTEERCGVWNVIRRNYSPQPGGRSLTYDCHMPSRNLRLFVQYLKAKQPLIETCGIRFSCSQSKC